MAAPDPLLPKGDRLHPITLYTATVCPYCEAKRAQLMERGQSFKEINVTERPDKIPELLKLTRGRRIVPVVVDGMGIAVAPEGGSVF